MRVYVGIKKWKTGYPVYNKGGVLIDTVDRLNLYDAYRTKKRNIELLCGHVSHYNEDVDAYYKLSEVDNLALDTVVMTGYEIYCNPLGTLLQKENS